MAETSNGGKRHHVCLNDCERDNDLGQESSVRETPQQFDAIRSGAPAPEVRDADSILFQSGYDGFIA